MSACTQKAKWELRADAVFETYTCTEHLSEMVSDDTDCIHAYPGDELCHSLRIHFDSIDGKWWRFEDGNPDRILTDEEAAEVVWGSGPSTLFDAMVKA